MRVVLVHPAGSNWIPGKKDISAIANRMAPLGLLSIAAYLERQGHEVSLLDCLGPKSVPDVETNARLVLAQRPDLVGFSCTTSSFLDGHEMATRIKTANPEIKTVFGAVHVSSLGGVLLERFSHIDSLCLGEGEQTMGELAAGREAAQISGLVWRDGSEIVTNPPRAPIADLDELPFPAYEKLPGFPRRYNLPLFSYVRFPGATMVTSRGCRYRCSYCDRSVFKRGFRSNSAEYIYEHMSYLRTRFRVRHINIYDDLFTTDRERVTALCDRLMASPLGIQFNCAVRLGHADNELLGLLKKAGCLQVSVGIESGDAGQLERYKEGASIERVRETIDRIQKNGLRAKGLFMMGLPGDTEESIRRSTDFILSLGLDDMNMSKFTPFPGAPIWSDIESDPSFQNDWRKMNCLNFVYLPTGVSSFEELDQLYNEHVQRFYQDRGWRKRFRKRLWQHRRSLFYLMAHWPSFLAAKRSFEPEKRPA
ncbi:MAG: radical SAM protein [bacterium]